MFQFNVGDRVMVPWGGGKTGTVARDEGGGDYLVELDELEDGRKKRIGCQGRLMQRVDVVAPAGPPPVEGMVTKGAGASGGGRVPLTAVVDPFADDDDDEGTGEASEPEPGAESNPEEPPPAT